jgi:hypothetical protein
MKINDTPYRMGELINDVYDNCYHLTDFRGLHGTVNSPGITFDQLYESLGWRVGNPIFINKFMPNILQGESHVH